MPTKHLRATDSSLRKSPRLARSSGTGPSVLDLALERKVTLRGESDGSAALRKIKRKSAKLGIKLSDVDASLILGLARAET